ncbi:MAG: uridine kinase [Deltaproteobacteria bacterium]|nr:uridine kinase [Deltaproteobacteria bacterium]
MPPTLIIGIAGGTGSGKTTIARRIVATLPEKRAILLDHDSYYRDQSHLPLEERIKVNFDHPDALENELLIEHVKRLKTGHGIEKPVYDFTTHTRKPETLTVAWAPVVVVEGILILADPRVRAQMDIKVFVDTDADIRAFRRIRRDMRERGRTFDSIRNQYYSTVRTMHLQFVEPSKRWADIIIPEGGHNEVALEMVIGRLQGFLDS